MDKVLRFTITILLAVAGLVVMRFILLISADILPQQISDEILRMGFFGITMANLISLLLGGIIGGGVGFFISPYIIGKLRRLSVWVELQLSKMPLHDVIAGASGLAIGLIIANLLGSAFSPIPIVGSYIPIVLNIVLGYMGIHIMIRKRKELIELLAALPKMREKGKEKEKDALEESERKRYKLLDTSVIIDGRIADICKSGFLEGTILLPVFILEELQHIADSSDLLKRNRGRRGLDVLNRIQKELGVYVQIDNRDFDDITEVDSKLVKLAQVVKGKIVTNDYNLNKVAELQGVPVLNINELSNAIKPVVIPGENMVVNVVKDGKEFGQGVAYLDDGTMIVVEGGKKHIGDTIEVLVTSVLQTAAGRMIFAKPKAMEKGA